MANAIVASLASMVNSMVNVTYNGAVKMNKRNNPLVNEAVTKVTKSNLLYSSKSYAELNGLAESGSLPFGEWEKGKENLVLSHNGKEYVRLYATKDTKSETTYFVNGAKATAEQVETIKAFLPKHTTTTEPKAYEPRTYAVESIAEVSKVA